MKIYGNTPRIFPDAPAKKATRTPNSAEKAPAAPNASVRKPKLNIPDNYRVQMGLNRKEQAFFEKLYPKARKEIQRYLQNQNSQPPVKGQIIDMKG